MFTVTLSAGAIFGLGVFTGVIATLVVLAVIAVSMNKKSTSNKE